MGLVGGELVRAGTECEPWREWRNLPLHPSIERALKGTGPRSVLVEIEGYGDLARNSTEWKAQLGHPRGLWAVCGDDAAEAIEVCEAYGIEWRGVAHRHCCAEDRWEALYEFDREFRRSFSTTRWTAPRLSPSLVSILVLGAIICFIAFMMFMLTTTSVASRSQPSTQTLMRTAEQGPAAAQGAEADAAAKQPAQ